MRTFSIVKTVYITCFQFTFGELGVETPPKGVVINSVVNLANIYNIGSEDHLHCGWSESRCL